jgi:hypothetical protein
MESPAIPGRFIFFIDESRMELHEDAKPTFEVALGELGVIEGEPLVKTLQDMANLVDGLVTSFHPLLA